MDSEERIAESNVENTIGTVRIASDVVATIAGMSATEVEGVAGMSGGVADGFAQMLGRKNMTKGVRVEINDQEATIDLYMIMVFGVAIAEVAKKVQITVKNTVENMTGLSCKAINIHVQGIMFPQANAAENE